MGVHDGFMFVLRCVNDGTTKFGLCEGLFLAIPPEAVGVEKWKGLRCAVGGLMSLLG